MKTLLFLLMTAISFPVFAQSPDYSKCPCIPKKKSDPKFYINKAFCMIDGHAKYGEKKCPNNMVMKEKALKVAVKPANLKKLNDKEKRKAFYNLGVIYFYKNFTGLKAIYVQKARNYFVQSSNLKYGPAFYMLGLMQEDKTFRSSKLRDKNYYFRQTLRYQASFPKSLKHWITQCKQKLGRTK